MSGRTPMGPKLVEHLEGSTHAKQRLEAILATLAGKLTVAEACEQLGMKEAMFHRLRTRVLQAGLSDLEPRPRGRPRHLLSPAEHENQRLAEEVTDLQQQLEIADVKRDLASILPHLMDEGSSAETEANSGGAKGEDSAIKKTTLRKKRRKRAQQKRRQKRYRRLGGD